jgi:hypothetical protein
MFVIPLHLQVQSQSSMPRGLPNKCKCACVKFTLKLVIFKCFFDGFGKI